MRRWARPTNLDQLRLRRDQLDVDTDRQAAPARPSAPSPSSPTSCALTTSSTAASAGRCPTGAPATSITRTRPAGRSTTSPSPTRCTTRWSHAGHRPLVELAFTPRALVPDGAEKTFPFAPSPTQWSPYEAGLWAMPPNDYQKWGGLVRALVEHCVARYGAEHVRGWLWELWNEPDIYVLARHARAVPRALRRDGGRGEGRAARGGGRRPDDDRRSRTRPARQRGPARVSRPLRAHRRPARLRVVPHEGRPLHALARLRATRRARAHARVAVEPQDVARGSRGARRRRRAIRSSATCRASWTSATRPCPLTGACTTIRTLHTATPSTSRSSSASS